MKKVFAAFLSLWLVFLQKSSATYGGCEEIVHITLVISEQVISPACSPRKSLVVNGTLPGPALHVNAGEHVHVRVWNEASTENVTVHWHGLSQFGSPFSDGTPSASQWPIPPGKYFDYEFLIDDDISGTFWYHAHVGVGVMTAHGAIIVHQQDGSTVDTNCPIPYDEERIFIVEDYFYKNDADLLAQALNGSFIGGANIILVNGQDWTVCNQTILDGLGYGTVCDTSCSYPTIEIEPDKTYLFRFIAATIDTFAGIAIQDHNVTLVQVDGGSWIEPYETEYFEMHTGQRYAAIVKGKCKQELEETKKLTYYTKVIDYQNGAPPGGSGPPGGGNSTGPPGGGPPGGGNATGPGGPGGPPGGGGPRLPPPPPTYAILTYKYPGCDSIDPSVYTSLPPATEELPFLPNGTVGQKYGLVTDTFKALNPIAPPPADLRIVLTTSQDTWHGKERDNLNGLAYFPDPSFVPLLVGMYNGEIIVDEDTIERAKTNNGFDNKTGAFVISRNAVLEIVLKNQIGEIGISVPHPFHLHGGDFWDLGAGSGPFTDEAFEAHLATMTPVRRDVTILGALPGTGTLDTPEGWRVFRWQPKNPGVWLFHCHITGHMMLGLQTQIVVGTNKDLPPLPKDYRGAYLSPGQTAAMGSHANQTDFIPYFITSTSPDPGTIG